MKKNLLVLLFALCFHACQPNVPSKEKLDSKLNSTSEPFIIPGEDDDPDPEKIKKGKVLIAYNDCYQCHREDTRAKGPSFLEIAKRYPIQKPYIELLARKIISGGSGTWGYPVMSPHPKLSEEKAQAMVWYIFSLDAN